MVKKNKYEISLGELELALGLRELGKDELNKLNNTLLGGLKLKEELENLDKDDVDKSLHVNLKPHGVYIQFDRRAIREGKREWSFMVRDTNLGGGEIPAEDWLKFSHLADLYSTFDDGFASIRLTTRQNFQFHRVAKKNLIPLVKELIKMNKPSLNGCGDNVRNTIACVVKSNVFDSNKLAKRIGEFFQLSIEDHKKVFGIIENKNDKNTNAKFDYGDLGLPRKLKIGIAGYYYDYNLDEYVNCNCCDILTNDIGIAPIIKNNSVNSFQVYIGGGLGQKSGKATFASLGGAFGIFRDEDHLMIGLEAIAKVQQQVGDRKNRHYARLKNVLISKGLENSDYLFEEVLIDENIFKKVRDEGIKWFREQVKKLGAKFDQPVNLKLGKLNRHHGWIKQKDSKYSYGLWTENGRLADSNPQGKVKSLVDEIVKEIKPKIKITPYQDLFFTDIEEKNNQKLEAILNNFNYGKYSKLKIYSQACVGLYTCPLAIAESENFFHPLITELEKRDYGNLDGVTIGISGCERHCSRNNRYHISIEGKGFEHYQLKLLLGKPEEDHLALDIINGDGKYLRNVHANNVADLISVLIDNYIEHRSEDENDIGIFHKRIGMDNIISLLKNNSASSSLMQKTYDIYLA